MRPIYKRVLTEVGARFAKSTRLTNVLRYISAGAWMQREGFGAPKRVSRREQVWDLVAQEVGKRKVLYLEFGVWQGAATRYWSKALEHPQSTLHGFDSFEGLPEKSGVWTKGQFDVSGSIPVIDDPRVKFFKGWFDAVLPSYKVPDHDQLVLNMDADLYSSTIFVLRHLRPWIKAGTYIYFDELNFLEHEARALTDFMKETGLKFEVVAGDSAFSGVFFRCLG